MGEHYRNLTPAETGRLERQGNYAEDWATVRVAEPFCADCLRNNSFEGEVNLGPRAAILGSSLRGVTVGEAAVIRNVRLLEGYTLGDNCTLMNINEMSCAKKDPVWLEPMNENGGRRILPFAGMTIGEAYMWARYRGRKRLMERLEEMTREALATDEGGYGRVGDCCTIKNTNCIRNVVIRSADADRTVVDGALALCDGVVGYGCTVEHGVIAERFLLGEHVHLEFGLRLNDTVVGDNSTLARCEVGNSIIFPAHEQHHNNSFLIAGLIMGQSNIAAGGTIGSNHNSRTADNEIAAGRGFWPGLCCSFKHSSRFASYCLLAKGDYPAELDIKLPFALVNNNSAKDQLEVMPAYWWLYNMYAMDRNSKKFAKRDKRVVKAQHIEFDNLAPDTAEEILAGMELLKKWKVESGKRKDGDGTVYAEGMEKGKRKTVILKADEGLKAYEDMLVFYAMKTLGEVLPTAHYPLPTKDWVNMGGQLVAKPDMEQLIADVENGTIGSWQAVHGRFDALWEAYPAQRKAHAYGVLCRLAGVDSLSDDLWQHYRQRYAEIQQYIEEQKAASRHKDEVNPFRNMTYWDDDERAAVLG